MEGLFSEEQFPSENIAQGEEENRASPLAARMRPRALDEFIGQERLIGPGTQLRRAIETDKLTSLLLWGPPGSGKSTLARLIARLTKSDFASYSAITSGVADFRKLVIAARARRRLHHQRTILFIDEIHRWNKAQQDALLPQVEDGTVLLIGATTENPYFTVNAPLLSRCRLLRLEPLKTEEILVLLQRALQDTERGLGAMNIQADQEAMEFLAEMAGGDARRALNALEAAAMTLQPDEHNISRLTLSLAEEGAQERSLPYDRDSDEHYDTISAFIKSMRGSDIDAALYWLAKMLEAGEDVRFIARRMVILASEDIGNADPMALVLANSAAQAVQFIGMPESQLILAQAVIYLSAAPKSASATIAINKAMNEIREHGSLPVPPHIADARSMQGRTSGDTPYLYPHDFPDHFIAQQYLPSSVQNLPFYQPTDQGEEVNIKLRIQKRAKITEERKQ